MVFSDIEENLLKVHRFCFFLSLTVAESLASQIANKLTWRLLPGKHEDDSLNVVFANYLTDGYFCKKTACKCS